MFVVITLPLPLPLPLVNNHFIACLATVEDTTCSLRIIVTRFIVTVHRA